MDSTILINLVLFMGVFAAAFSSQDDSDTTEDDEDSLYDRGDYAGSQRGTSGDDDFAATTDNLAWFMEEGDDQLQGSSARDYADMGEGNDRAGMGAGNDIVESGTGNDSIWGGTGDDIELGDYGDDALYGELGNDSLAGEEGDDWVIGGSGSDILAGGDGNDIVSGFDAERGATASMTNGDGTDQLYGGNGDDELLLGRGDMATGGAGDDNFALDARWRDGSGLFTIKDYEAESDTITLVYAPTIDPNTSEPVLPTITVQDSADGASSLILMNGVIVAEVEGVTGLSADNILLEADSETDTGYRPEAFDDVLEATEGNDDLTGSEGDDYGRLDTGDDTADLGAGADSVRGEEGHDEIAGDTGNDSLFGGDGADTLDGGADNDVLTGGKDDDVLGGGDGADLVQGGAGHDTVSGHSADGAGGTASATDGADTLSGGLGDDLLIIGRGDTAVGGEGADSFALDARLNDTTAIATISDFLRGTDQIELVYTPRYDSGGAEIPPDLRVLSGPNGAYSVIMLDGEPVAHVTGVSDLTVAEVTLVRDI